MYLTVEKRKVKSVDVEFQAEVGYRAYINHL
jgi:hypothetical protein